jgi:predicted HTH transcriptional regulator
LEKLNFFIKIGDAVRKDSVAEILKYIENDATISLPKLAQLLNVSSKTVQRDLDKLKEKRLFDRTDSRKKGKWIIRKKID